MADMSLKEANEKIAENLKKVFMPSIRKHVDEVVNCKGFLLSKALGGPGPLQILDVTKLNDEQVMELWREMSNGG